MTFEITISGVDGETNVIVHTPHMSLVREALKQHDHEGSIVTLRVCAEGQAAYDLLMALEKASHAR